MKLLYWSELFWPHIGGIEVLSLQLLPALTDRGYEVAVVTSHSELDLPDKEERKGVSIHRFRFREAVRDRDPAAMLRARKAVAGLRTTFRPDVTHLNFSGPSGFFHLGTTGVAPSPWLLATRTSIPEESQARALLLKLIHGADWVTSNSAAMMGAVRGLAPEIEGRSSVIHNGLAAPDIEPTPLPFGPPTILCLGRILKKKGFDLALHAQASLIERHPDLRLVIAGDGPDRRDLELTARDLGIADRVEFIGWVQPHRVLQIINECTVVVVPSRWEEPFCLVAVQAGLMRRPVVASRAGGLGEVVSHNETGILVQKDDANALAAAIGSLVEDPDRARVYGEAGRVRARERFSIERYVNEHDVLYRRLVRRGG